MRPKEQGVIEDRGEGRSLADRSRSRLWPLLRRQALHLAGREREEREAWEEPRQVGQAMKG